MANTPFVRLPLTTAGVEALFLEYTDLLLDYVSSPDSEQKTKLLTTLETLKKKCVTNVEVMYSMMGYEGSWEECEKQLNENIRSLQSQTSFMNGEKLQDFMLRELSKALPYSPSFQAKYEAYLKKTFGEEWREMLGSGSAEWKEKFAEAIIKDFELATAIGEYSISLNGGHVRGIGRKGGTTPVINLTAQFHEFSGNLQKRMMKRLDKIKITKKGEKDSLRTTFDCEIDDKMLYSLLTMKSTTDKDGLGIDSIDFDGSLTQRVKEALINKIVEAGKQIEKQDIFREVVTEIVENAEPQDLFAGKNAVKKMTGLLGEIQAVFYMRVLFPALSSSWDATDFVRGKQGHIDITLKGIQDECERLFGIQVKNSSKDEAQQEVNFHSFGFQSADDPEDELTDFLHLRMNMDDMNTVISKYYQVNSEVLQGIASFLGMEYFNIPYVYKGSSVAAGFNPYFAPIRRDIEDAAELAREASNIFCAAMLYMQTEQEINMSNKQWNSLYILSGKMAISSAGILTDTINRLENHIKALDVNFHSKLKGAPTIVDFLQGRQPIQTLGKSLYIQSSYAFDMSNISTNI